MEGGATRRRVGVEENGWCSVDGMLLGEVQGRGAQLDIHCGFPHTVRHDKGSGGWVDRSRPTQETREKIHPSMSDFGVASGPDLCRLCFTVN